MDLKLFFIGVGFLMVGYLMYRSIKNERPSSEENNWNGLTLSNYIGYWGSLVMLIIVGIAFVLKSLPAKV
ncbi:hypothetical protein AQ505_10985 [Pedobacter sp. PACM 27299]|nr:hypothetical protein AQ505_10985 [Pedobacter sp. PACM 27299]